MNVSVLVIPQFNTNTMDMAKLKLYCFAALHSIITSNTIEKNEKVENLQQSFSLESESFYTTYIQKTLEKYLDTATDFLKPIFTKENNDRYKDFLLSIINKNKIKDFDLTNSSEMFNITLMSFVNTILDRDDMENIIQMYIAAQISKYKKSMQYGENKYDIDIIISYFKIDPMVNEILCISDEVEAKKIDKLDLCVFDFENLQEIYTFGDTLWYANNKECALQEITKTTQKFCWNIHKAFSANENKITKQEALKVLQFTTKLTVTELYSFFDVKHINWYLGAMNGIDRNLVDWSYGLQLNALNNIRQKHCDVIVKLNNIIRDQIND